jgi:hypothetical protein
MCSLSTGESLHGDRPTLNTRTIQIGLTAEYLDCIVVFGTRDMVNGCYLKRLQPEHVMSSNSVVMTWDPASTGEFARAISMLLRYPVVYIYM